MGDPRTNRRGLAFVLVAAAVLWGAPAIAQTVVRAVMHAEVKHLDPHWTTANITQAHGYMIYETLFALDSKGVPRPQMVDRYTMSADKLTYTFTLRNGLKWHDGQPVTADDVIFSFEALKANSPTYAFYYANVTKAEKTGEREVTFTFNEKGNRELPQIMGQLIVLPKHWWEGTAPDGSRRDITQTTLEPPLGSGPYRLKNFDTGRNATYERVKDYWGSNLNVNVGQNNFDEIRYEYYRDATVLLEAFKIRGGKIQQVEAVFITVPYNMPSPWEP